MFQTNNIVTNANATVSIYSTSSRTENIASKDTEAGTASVNSTPAYEVVTAKAAGDTTEFKSSPAYSVEISQQGARLSSLNSETENDEATGGTASGNSSTSAVTTTISEKTNSQIASTAASGTTSTSSDSATASDTSTDNLALYSDYQLLQMLNNGEIMQSEYNAEISSRKAEKQTWKYDALSEPDNSNITSNTHSAARPVA